MNAVKSEKKPVRRKAGLVTVLARFYPCADATAWLATQTSARLAWQNCKRGDWMLWLLGKTAGEAGSASRKKLVLAAAECASTSLPIFEKCYPNDKRVRECINMVKRYARGKATIEEVRAARQAAADAAYAADAAAYAAAAAAADAAAYAAAAAADAAAAYAAAYADAADARQKAHAKALKRCAAIVRKHYPNPPRIAK